MRNALLLIKNRLFRFNQTRFIILTLALLLLSVAWTTATAHLSDVATDPIAVLQRSIQDEKKDLRKLDTEIQLLQEKQRLWSAQSITSKSLGADLEQARLALESVQVDLQSSQLDQTSAQHQIDKLQSTITELQHQISNLKNSPEQITPALEAKLTEQLKQQQSLLALKQQYLDILNDRIRLLQRKVALSRQWLNTLQQAAQRQQEDRLKENLADLENRLQMEIQQKQAKVNDLQQQLDAFVRGGTITQPKRQDLTHRIQVLNEYISLINGKQKLAADQTELEAITLDQINQAAPDTLSEWKTRLDDLRQRITPAIKLVDGKIKLLNQQLQLLEKRHSLQGLPLAVYNRQRNDLNQLIEQYQRQKASLQQLQKEVKTRSAVIDKTFQQNLNRSLTARQPLPKDPEVWRSLLIEAGHIPTILVQAVTASVRNLATGWSKSDLNDRFGFATVVFLLTLVSMGLGHLPCPRPYHMTEGQTFTMKAREVLYALLRGSRLMLFTSGTLLAAVWLFGLKAQRFQLLLLVIIWFVCQWMAQLSYWLFVSPLIPAAQRQPRIHYTILWITGIAAVFTLLVGMGHSGLLSGTMREVVDRMFMLLLLPLVYLSLHLRKLMVLRMQAEWRSAFWPRLVALLSFAIPLTILATAVIGLIGYINLAWFLARQLAQFLALMMIWVVLRHLIMDALNHWRQRVHSRSKQAVIDLIQHLVNVVLLLLFLWLLMLLATWSTGTDLISFTQNKLGNTLFTVNGHSVTLMHLFGTLVLTFLIPYLGSWSRHLTYDLLYLKIRDRGLRNSLSVFTQYAIIVFGLLLALNLLGIDLTSLTVFAGALGVGIGFGLQNIANNFISGLILLAERPVRTEDWVTTGDHQGRIKRIGMRSLTLTTWDNQDVIIPNAQLITNPVINWTLSDSLVRTVFVVGIRYQDDPHRAKQVIEEAISMKPAVSQLRPPRVLLTEFGDSSVNFRIEYFAIVTRQSERLKIKSDVMFSIWDALKEAEIGIPFPQQDIYIKEVPDSAFPDNLNSRSPAQASSDFDD